MKLEIIGYFEMFTILSLKFNLFTLRSAKCRVKNMTTSHIGSTGQICHPMIDEDAVSDGNHGTVALLMILSDVQKSEIVVPHFKD